MLEKGCQKYHTAVSKPLSIVLVALVILFGAYSIGTSGFLSWITTPFTAANIQQGSSKPFRNRSKPRKSRRHGKYRKTEKWTGQTWEQGKVENKQGNTEQTAAGVGGTFSSIIGFFCDDYLLS